MALLDQLLRSALSQAKVSNPLMLALLALLGRGHCSEGAAQLPLQSLAGRPRRGMRVAICSRAWVVCSIVSGRAVTERPSIRGSAPGRTSRFRRANSEKRSDPTYKTLAERSGMSEEELLKQLRRFSPV